MKLTLMTGAVVACLSLPSPLSGQAADRPAVQADGPLADSLRSFSLHMLDLLRRRDTGGVIGLYGDTLHFVHVDKGHIIPWSTLSRMFTSYLDSVPSNPISVIDEPGVILMDENNAAVYVTHRFEGGPHREPHEGVWTGVLHRFRDGWRIVHSHSSDRDDP